jgi:putative membrane protein
VLLTLTAGFDGSGWHIGFAAKCTQIMLAGAGLVVGATLGAALGVGVAVGFDVGRAVGSDGLRPVALALGVGVGVDVGDELLAGVGELPAGVGEPAGVGVLRCGVGELPTGVGELPAGVGELLAGVGVLPTGVGVLPIGVDVLLATGVADAPGDGESDARGEAFTGEIKFGTVLGIDELPPLHPAAARAPIVKTKT